FQPAKLDARTDKDFIGLYFPSERKGASLAGDFADGSVTILKDNEEYTVSKEWSKQPVYRLSTPDGIFRDEANADSVLKKVLGYGEGVYADLLFSSQRNTDLSLESVLDAKNDTQAKRELVTAVTKAFSQSGGINIDSIERAIKEKIEETAGKHWDTEKNQPQRKAGRWVNGVGEILKAYYALEDAQKLTEELRTLEAQCDDALSDYAKLREAVQEAEENNNRLSTFSASAAVFVERKRRLKILVAQLEKCRTDAEKWPVVLSGYEKGCALLNQQENRAVADKYEKAKKIHDELEQYQAVLLSSPPVTTSDLTEVRTQLREIDRLKSKLCAMNISAKIKMLGENSVEITAVGTNEKIEPDDEIILNQAVDISVPGVMQMQLSPADIDTGALSDQLEESRRIVDTILKKYKSDSIDDLEQKAQYLSSVELKARNARSNLQLILSEESFEEFEKQAVSAAGKTRTNEEIKNDIFDLTGGKDIVRFVAAAQAEIKAFESAYTSLDDLRRKISETGEEIEKVQQLLAGTNDIPQEYLEIEDIDAYCQSEREKLKQLRQKSEQALQKKTEAVQKLEAFKETYGEDIRDRLDKASSDFENQKVLFACWENILRVFQECKRKINENPTEDLAESFSYYLSVLTDKKVSSDFSESDTLDMKIFSSDCHVGFRQLSEGTKQTVSLAFRLAVLDHLFPDGGVIVLDDPFSDMDAERRSKACKLVTMCAERHQVIFLTCHSGYEALFNTKAESIE
ncbi:MAG: ATP-binding protein, partial [Acutalibacteraceae bacterium]